MMTEEELDSFKKEVDEMAATMSEVIKALHERLARIENWMIKKQKKDDRKIQLLK